MNECKIVTRTTTRKFVHFDFGGKPIGIFGCSELSSSEYHVYVTGGPCINYNDLELYRDLFMQSTPEIVSFIQKKSGLTLAKCQFLIDEWTNAVALFQQTK